MYPNKNNLNCNCLPVIRRKNPWFNGVIRVSGGGRRGGGKVNGQCERSLCE